MNPQWPYPQYPVPVTNTSITYAAQSLQQNSWNIQDNDPATLSVNSNIPHPTPGFIPATSSQLSTSLFIADHKVFPLHVPPPNIISTKVPPPTFCSKFLPPSYQHPITVSHSSQYVMNECDTPVPYSLSDASPPPLPSSPPPPLPSVSPPPLPPTSPPPLPLDSPPLLLLDSPFPPVPAESSSSVSVIPSTPVLNESTFLISSESSDMPTQPQTLAMTNLLPTSDESQVIPPFVSNKSLSSVSSDVSPSMTTVSSPIESVEFSSSALPLTKSSPLSTESLTVMSPKLCEQEESIITSHVSTTSVTADLFPPLNELSPVLNNPASSVSSPLNVVKAAKLDEFSSPAQAKSYTESSVLPTEIKSSPTMVSKVSKQDESSVTPVVSPICVSDDSFCILNQSSLSPALNSPAPANSFIFSEPAKSKEFSSAPTYSNESPSLTDKSLQNVVSKLSEQEKSSVLSNFATSCVSDSFPVLIQTTLSPLLNSPISVASSPCTFSEASKSDEVSSHVPAKSISKLSESLSTMPSKHDKSPVAADVFVTSALADSFPLLSISASSSFSDHESVKSVEFSASAPSKPLTESPILPTASLPTTVYELSERDESSVVSADSFSLLNQLTLSPLINNPPSSVSSPDSVAESAKSVEFSASAPTKPLIELSTLPSESLPTIVSELSEQDASFVVPNISATNVSADSFQVLNESSLLHNSETSESNPFAFVKPAKSEKFSSPTPIMSSTDSDSLVTESLPIIPSKLFSDSNESSTASIVSTTCISDVSCPILIQPALPAVLNSPASSTIRPFGMSKSAKSNEFSSVLPNESLSSMPSKLSQQDESIVQVKSSLISVESSVAPNSSSTCVSGDSFPISIPSTLSSVLKGSTSASSTFIIPKPAKPIEFSSPVPAKSLAESSFLSESLPIMTSKSTYKQDETSVISDCSVALNNSAFSAPSPFRAISAPSSPAELDEFSSLLSTESLPKSPSKTLAEQDKTLSLKFPFIVSVKSSVSPEISTTCVPSDSFPILNRTTLPSVLSSPSFAVESPVITSKSEQMPILFSSESTPVVSSNFHSVHDQVSHTHVSETNNGDPYSTLQSPTIISPNVNQSTAFIEETTAKEFVCAPTSLVLIKSEESAFIHFAEAMVSQPQLSVNTTASSKKYLPDTCPSDDQRILNFVQRQVMQEHSYSSLSAMNECNLESNSSLSQEHLHLSAVIAQEHDYCLPLNEQNPEVVLIEDIVSREDDTHQHSVTPEASSPVQLDPSFTRELDQNLSPVNHKKSLERTDSKMDTDSQSPKIDQPAKVINSNKHIESHFEKLSSNKQSNNEDYDSKKLYKNVSSTAQENCDDFEKTQLDFSLDKVEKANSNLELTQTKNSDCNSDKADHSPAIIVSEKTTNIEIKHIKSQSEVLFSNKKSCGKDYNLENNHENLSSTVQENKEVDDSIFSTDKINRPDIDTELAQTKNSEYELESVDAKLPSNLLLNESSNLKNNSQNLALPINESQKNKMAEPLSEVEKLDHTIKITHTKVHSKTTEVNENIKVEKNLFKENVFSSGDNNSDSESCESICVPLSTKHKTDIKTSSLSKNIYNSDSNKNIEMKNESCDIELLKNIEKLDYVVEKSSSEFSLTVSKGNVRSKNVKDISSSKDENSLDDSCKNICDTRSKRDETDIKIASTSKNTDNSDPNKRTEFKNNYQEHHLSVSATNDENYCDLNNDSTCNQDKSDYNCKISETKTKVCVVKLDIKHSKQVSEPLNESKKSNFMTEENPTMLPSKDSDLNENTYAKNENFKEQIVPSEDNSSHSESCQNICVPLNNECVADIQTSCHSKNIDNSNLIKNADYKGDCCTEYHLNVSPVNCENYSGTNSNSVCNSDKADESCKILEIKIENCDPELDIKCYKQTSELLNEAEKLSCGVKESYTKSPSKISESNENTSIKSENFMEPIFSSKDSDSLNVSCKNICDPLSNNSETNIKAPHHSKHTDKSDSNKKAGFKTDCSTKHLNVSSVNYENYFGFNTDSICNQDKYNQNCKIAETKNEICEIERDMKHASKSLNTVQKSDLQAEKSITKLLSEISALNENIKKEIVSSSDNSSHTESCENICDTLSNRNETDIKIINHSKNIGNLESDKNSDFKAVCSGDHQLNVCSVNHENYSSLENNNSEYNQDKSAHNCKTAETKNESCDTELNIDHHNFNTEVLDSNEHSISKDYRNEGCNENLVSIVKNDSIDSQSKIKNPDCNQNEFAISENDVCKMSDPNCDRNRSDENHKMTEDMQKVCHSKLNDKNKKSQDTLTSLKENRYEGNSQDVSSMNDSASKMCDLSYFGFSDKHNKIDQNYKIAEPVSVEQNCSSEDSLQNLISTIVKNDDIDSQNGINNPDYNSNKFAISENNDSRRMSDLNYNRNTTGERHKATEDVQKTDICYSNLNDKNKKSQFTAEETLTSRKEKKYEDNTPRLTSKNDSSIKRHDLDYFGFGFKYNKTRQNYEVSESVNIEHCDSKSRESHKKSRFKISEHDKDIYSKGDLNKSHRKKISADRENYIDKIYESNSTSKEMNEKNASVEDMKEIEKHSGKSRKKHKKSQLNVSNFHKQINYKERKINKTLDFDSASKKRKHSNSVESPRKKHKHSTNDAKKIEHSHSGISHRKRKHTHENYETKEHDNLTRPKKKHNHSTESSRIREISPSYINHKKREHSHSVRSHRKKEQSRKKKEQSLRKKELSHSAESPRKSRSTSVHSSKSLKSQRSSSRRHSPHLKKTTDDHDSSLIKNTKNKPRRSRSPESIKSFYSHHARTPESIKNSDRYHSKSPENLKSKYHQGRSPKSTKRFHSHHKKSLEDVKVSEKLVDSKKSSDKHFDKLKKKSPNITSTDSPKSKKKNEGRMRRRRSRRRSSTPKDLPCLSLKTYKYVSSTPADDYYSSKDKDAKEVFAKDALKSIHEKFKYELVERAERIRASKPKYEPPKRKTKLRKPKPPKTDSNSDSSSSSEKSSSDEEDTAMEELERKKKHPYRLHLELWFNDPKEMNDGPLCRCSAKARRAGIRHGIYVGEDHLPLCNPLSNNTERLYHYRITMTPHTNFLTKNPTTIYHNGHGYRFEGFSMFSHSKLPVLPNCKVIRFNYEYTIVYAEEEFPKNFTVEGLELFSSYLLTEILELVDLNWKAHNDPDGCPRFHFMPRFARELKDGGKELLSHCYVLDYLLKQNQILVDEKKISDVLSLNNHKWQDLADEVKGMIITCPGMKPSSIRVDQIDREQCVPDKEEFPVIVHFGVRPPQLSYAGNPHYQKAWRDYVKYRHLLANKPKVRYADRHKLLQKECRLQEMRMENDLKRDVTIVISSKNFYKTGIMSDIVQHAMLLPVLVCHLRFHQSLTYLENKLGYKFQDRFLLQLALTHPSYRENFGTNPDHARNSLTNCGLRQPQYGDRRIHYMNTRKRGINTLINIMSRFGSRKETLSRINHNERLEFLGDAVVEFLSSIHLFYMFPDLEEGGLATYRAAIVQNQHLAVLSKKLELDRFMLYAHGSDLCHDLELRHAMANCFEALMGALFLDNGIEIADKVFSKTLFSEQELLEVWLNFSPHPLQEQEPEGDRRWIESVPLLQKLHKFEETIGIEFNHIRLLARALTHRSLGYNNLTLGSNQRLEFLGDTVLQLVASEYLYKFFPEHHEGHLSLLRSSLVNNRTQAVVCADLGMVDYAIYPDNKVELKPKDKADLLEAFLGALYVDKDLGYCRKFCEVCFFPRLQDFIMNQDWNDPKSKLQQCCLTLRSMDGGEPDIPTYKVIECKGPTNTRVYSVAVYFQGSRLAVGSGHSIQQAEMDAASNALMISKDLFPQLRHQRRAIERSLKKRPLNKNKPPPKK